MPFLDEAERTFWSNAKYNESLAKAKTRPRRRGIYRIMKPDVLIARLKGLGISVDRRTLARYVKDELVTKPEYKHGGKGTGPIVDYPDQAVAEAAAAADLMQRFRWKKKIVAMSRRLACVMDEYGRWDEGAAFVRMVELRQIIEEATGIRKLEQEDVLFATMFDHARVWRRTFESYSKK